MQCRTAFVTGAGSGIGLALAETLARRGARVAAFDLRFSDAARSRLRQVCPDALFFEVDVRDAAGVATAVNQAVAQIGAPDVALNSAGVQVARPFLDIASESYDFVIDVNLKGSRNFAAAVLPHMRSGGHLALVASLAGVVEQLRLRGVLLVQVRCRRARFGVTYRVQDARHRRVRHLPAGSPDADGGRGASHGPGGHHADQAVCRNRHAARSLPAGHAWPGAGPIHDRSRQLARPIHSLPGADLPTSAGTHYGQDGRTGIAGSLK